MSSWLTSVTWSKNYLSLTWFGSHCILAFINVSIGVPSNYNWLHPPWNQSWNIFYNYWFSENSPIQNISDCAVGRFPHLLKFKFFYSVFVGSDGSTLDTNFAFLNSFSSVNCDLIFSLVSVLNGQIVVLNIQI